jgi:hypothetical protein
VNEPLTYECSVHFRRRGRGARKELATGPNTASRVAESGRVPRVARLMALAIRFEGYLRAGQVSDHTELAELGHVTRARISQIMSLLNLAPDIQEAILFLPRTEQGRDAIHLRDLQPIARTVDWRKQRRMCDLLTDQSNLFRFPSAISFSGRSTSRARAHLP